MNVLRQVTLEHLVWKC